MKKLLILLLLIPTLIQAEEFNLVCEGEELYTFDSRDGWKDKKIIVVKVREESIRIENSTYSTQKKNNSAGNFESLYTKDTDLITVFLTNIHPPKKNNCQRADFTASIDRVSGLIKTESRITDKCRGKKWFMGKIYEGRCKKQKGNAF